MAVFVKTPQGDTIELSWRERIPGIDDNHHLKRDIENFGITVDESPETGLIYKQVKWGVDLSKSMVSLERNGEVCYLSRDATIIDVLDRLHLICTK